MKLKNPKGSTFESTGLLVLGLVGGAMLGRGLMAIVPNKTGLTEAEMKKQELMNYGARILIAGGGVTGAAYAKENFYFPSAGIFLCGCYPCICCKW